jgi:hypothetical protein
VEVVLVAVADTDPVVDIALVAVADTDRVVLAGPAVDIVRRGRMVLDSVASLCLTCLSLLF